MVLARGAAPVTWCDPNELFHSVAFPANVPHQIRYQCYSSYHPNHLGPACHDEVSSGTAAVDATLSATMMFEVHKPVNCSPGGCGLPGLVRRRRLTRHHEPEPVSRQKMHSDPHPS